MKKKTLYMLFSLMLLTTACAGKEKQERETNASVAEESDDRESEEGTENSQESVAVPEAETSTIEPAQEALSSLPAAPSSPPAVPSSAPLPSSVAAPQTARSSATQAEKIQHIRDVYGRTVQNQGNYRQSGGKYYMADGTLAKAVTSNGNQVLDEVMRKNGYSTYGLEYYYEDHPGGEDYPIFIYAVIDGKEYRYYFCQGEFIRRVGPESGGSTNDSPEMNSFIRTLRDEGASYRLEASSSAPAQPAPQPRQQLSHEDKIAYIQGVYQRIEQELSPYGGGGRYYYDGGHSKRITVSMGGNYTLDDAMKKYGYSTYVLTYYYDSEDRVGYYNGYPVLVHGMIDEKEYWYYFYEDEFIRRVGPENGGNTNDTPTMNSFIETILNEGYNLGYVCGA